jgi:hypothetical protein
MLCYKFWMEKRWQLPVGLFLLCLLGLVPAFIRGSFPAGMPPHDLWSNGNLLIYAWAGAAAGSVVNGLPTDIFFGSVLYTLALPVTRRKLLAVWAGVAMMRLAAFALVPSVLVSAFALLAGRSYPVSLSLLHAFFLFVGGTALYCYCLLVAVIFCDLAKTAFASLGLVSLVTILSATGFLRQYDPYQIMKGASYFTGGGMPWGGIAISLALGAVFYWIALQVLERRDF